MTTYLIVAFFVVSSFAGRLSVGYKDFGTTDSEKQTTSPNIAFLQSSSLYLLLSPI